VEGVDEARVTRWFRDHVAGAQPPLRFTLVAGGRSNLTFEVTDAGGRAWVLRRPPTGHVLPTAHDMSREYRIISALGPTPVPVPAAVGLCTDPDVNGAPFYVMSHVDGHILRTAADAERVLDQAARRTAGLDLARVLAALHAVDVDAVGLGTLARREGYIARQLERWYTQFRSSTAATGRLVPAVDEVHRALAARIPDQHATAVVHGDYRLDNTMLRVDGTVAAVLDWELCTLGDPLADVGLLVVYWAEAGDGMTVLGEAPTAVAGFPSRAELKARYAEITGRDVGDLGFYVAFAYWKLACILEGVYTRYLGGSGGGDRSDFDGYRAKVVALAEAARQAL
jgi:aminoglycoside phosphotransferase (APT) family kinase protein